MTDEPNRLINCSSPYLRQHAYNPVDWYPWGEEAIERAREEDKPILLSIGYSACHWCHVMERECFEDPDIARLMNESFACIKVDREERPDLDDIYMRAVQMLTGSGGWPLTVFLTPDLEPFYGGTYFPPSDRGGMPGFPRVLRSVADAYENRREDVTSTARELRQAIEQSATPPTSETLIGDDILSDALDGVSQSYDRQAGGFGRVPKFPQTPVLRWLLDYSTVKGAEEARSMLVGTLDAMMRGGIFDQIGGGFHRYAVDRDWRVPHFEKMLYDNAQLCALYADASRALDRPDYLSVAIETARYVLETFRAPQGGFYSAQDADSEGEEGVYYAWTREEIIECLGPEDGALAARLLGVTEQGNWEDGRNVLYRAESPEEARRVPEKAKEKLLEARNERVAPAVDDKVLADWNGLMIRALARLHRATGEADYLDAARGAAEFLLEEMWRDGKLVHNWRDGRTGDRGYLADYAQVAGGLIDLHECTFELRWLRRARDLAERMVELFWDEDEGVFRDAEPGSPDLIAPVSNLTDQPAPSGPSAACGLLLRTGRLFEAPVQIEIAERAMATSASLLEQSPLATGAMLSAVLRYLSEPRELVIVEPQAGPLRAAADTLYLPHVLRAGCRPGQADEVVEDVPLLAGKGRAEDGSAAYLCSGGACREPVSEPSELRRQLESLLS